MRYAIVKNEKVMNIIEADEVNAGIIADSLGATAIQSDTAGIGQAYIEGVFADIPHVEVPDSPAVTALKSILLDEITILNAKYSGLELLITDSPAQAIPKLLMVQAQISDCNRIDLLYRYILEAGK